MRFIFKRKMTASTPPIVFGCEKNSFQKISLLFLAFWLAGSSAVLASPQGRIEPDVARKLVTLTDGAGDLVLRLNYNRGCVLDEVRVRGRDVAAPAGVATGILVDGKWFMTGNGIAAPTVALGKSTVTVSGIKFSGDGLDVDEAWQFTVKASSIVWRITRRYSEGHQLQDEAFPQWNFANLSTWTGGMLDNGGVVLNKYLDTPNATYGGHAGTVTFWSREHDDCLRIIPALPGNQQGAVRFSHQPDGTFSFNYVISRDELKPAHDLRRYLGDHQDLWAPFQVQPGAVTAEFTLEALDYDQAYARGTFPGLDGGNIRELLNTVARYGVIDRRLVGGNGWRSGYICLHEPFFGEIALALDAPDYTANLAACLDYERDHAIEPDGRVKSRWTYDAGDAMPGTFDSLGFYEAQWGYLMDSQPDYVIDVAGEFNLLGDKQWLAGQKTACERALDFLLRREVGHSGLVRMMTDSCAQQRGSDWIDIIWASYENALVNAELYDALTLWAADEERLGDSVAAAKYRDFAARLKASFNQPISKGGFWDPAHQWYVYWRDQDGSIHGNNLVVPVNFAAIAYGLCDDASRQSAILDQMETGMQKENLFSWPLNFYPYDRPEGAGSNFPFPRYENGDLFLSWDELGVRAYAVHDPAIALKYVRKILARYAQDGLSYQRYLRNSQEGAGDDILAGNCMAVAGLYRDIYGIQPQPDRLYLEPHLTVDLNGTEVRYQLRKKLYLIDLATTNYSVSVDHCTLMDSRPFAVNTTASELQFFSGTNISWEMAISRTAGQSTIVQIENWPDDPAQPRQWTETVSPAGTTITHTITGLNPHTAYKLIINGQTIGSFPADKFGTIRFTHRPGLAMPEMFQLGV